MKDLNIRDGFIMADFTKLSVDPSFHSDQPKTEIRDSKWEHNGMYMINNGFPLQLDIELNTTCNLNCIMCFQSKCKPKAEYMEFNNILDLIDQGKENGLESIKLQYRGEPLLYPKLIDVISYAKHVGLYVHFNTNASLLTKSMIKKLIYSGLDKIICSVDSIFPEKYNDIRIGSDFNTILENINLLKIWKYVYEKDTPQVRVQAVLMDLNKREIETNAYQNFWITLANSVGYEEAFDMLDNTEDNTELSNWHCGQLWQRLVILADGDVIPCCGGIDYKKGIIYSVGNIHHETVKGIWNNKKLNKIRELHCEGNSHKVEMCRKCRIRKLVINKIESDKN